MRICRRLGPLLAVFVLSGRPARADGAAAPTFETLARGAVQTTDVATVLAPLIDSCGGEMREVDRARCRATTGYLRRTLPSQTFEVRATDPAAIDLSSYDAAATGYHLALTGCLACSQPMALGSRGERRLVTLAKPDRTAPTLAAGVRVAKHTFTFSDVAAAKKWIEAERPFLTAEFLFQPQVEGAEFTIGMAPGVALKLVGGRVYNRCTGEVLLSQPPSIAPAARSRENAGADCGGGPGATLAASTAPAGGEASGDAAAPDELSKTAIGEVLGKIRPQLYDCYEKYRVPGALVLSYVVGGDGAVQSVKIGSAFAGTPTGSCALDIARDVKFPAFKRDRQEFKYLVYLRHP
jgi:hypothetical protein